VVHAHIKSFSGSDASGDTVMLRSLASKYDGLMTRAKAPCKYVMFCYREGIDSVWRVVLQRVHATLDLRAEAQIGDSLNGV
jgi:hypothetical protein